MDSYRQATAQPLARRIEDLVFVGFNSRLAAVDRDTGEIVWKWKAPKGRHAYVGVLLDGDRLIVSVHGYTYGIDPVSGEQLWMNRFKRFGYGVPSLTSLLGSSGSAAAAAIIAQQRAQTAGAAGA